MKPSEYNVLDLIPQRPPMTMIDSLTYADEKSARGRLYVDKSNLFCNQGILGEPGLIEFIAQTAAAYTGYRSKLAHREITEGYIGSVKNLIIHELPSEGTVIDSEIVVENEIVGYTIITGRIFQGEKLLAECEMRILGKRE